MNDVLFYGIIFLIIYFCYVLFVITRKKKLQKFENNIYVKYLEKLYHLDLSQLNMKSLAHTIALSNSLIITITLWAVGITNHYLYKMLLAIAILIPFQLLIYHIIGKIYQIKNRRQ